MPSSEKTWTDPSPSWWRAALWATCPRCGRGSLFVGLLHVREHCPVCGFDLRAQDSGDGPVAFIILIVGFAVVIPVLVIEARGGWPLVWHFAIWLPLAVILCVALMRPFKAGLIALQYAHRRQDFEDDQGQSGTA